MKHKGVWLIGAVAAVALCGVGTVLSVDRNAAQPPQAGRICRELITVSITEPKTIKPLWINEEQAYAAETNCIDQFSDDGGLTWQDIGPDTASPPPSIVWSATTGSFLSYSGTHTTYQAPDGFLVNDEINDEIYACAVTTGNDIYGAPATTAPNLTSSTDGAATKPAVSTQPLDFKGEFDAAMAATDRDQRIEHLRRALVLRPGDPLNIQLEFRIANMLCFNPDVKHHEPVHPIEALAIFEGIADRYDHKHYYESNPPNASDNPQLMVPRSEVLAASILMIHPEEAAKAEGYLKQAMKDLQWTLDHRRKDWATAPKPVDRPEFHDFEPSGDFARQLGYWESRKRQAGSTDANAANGMMGAYAISLASTAVHLYLTSTLAHDPNGATAVMNGTIAEFRDTPMAQAARHEMDPNQPAPRYPIPSPSTGPVH